MNFGRKSLAPLALLVFGALLAWFVPLTIVVQEPPGPKIWFRYPEWIFVVTMVPTLILLTARRWYLMTAFFCFGAVTSCPLGICLFILDPPIYSEPQAGLGNIFLSIAFYFAGGIAVTVFAALIHRAVQNGSRKLLILIVLLTFSPILSISTGLISVGRGITHTSSGYAVIVKYFGLPIPFYESPTGYARMDIWHGKRFLANTFIIGITAIAVALLARISSTRHSGERKISEK